MKILQLGEKRRKQRYYLRMRNVCLTWIARFHWDINKRKITSHCTNHRKSTDKTTALACTRVNALDQPLIRYGGLSGFVWYSAGGIGSRSRTWRTVRRNRTEKVSRVAIWCLKLRRRACSRFMCLYVCMDIRIIVAYNRKETLGFNNATTSCIKKGFVWQKRVYGRNNKRWRLRLGLGNFNADVLLKRTVIEILQELSQNGKQELMYITFLWLIS